jgi:hypothetical protein
VGVVTYAAQGASQPSGFSAVNLMTSRDTEIDTADDCAHSLIVNVFELIATDSIETVAANLRRQWLASG